MEAHTGRRLNDLLLVSGLAGLVTLAVLLDLLRNALLNGAETVGDQQRLLFLLPLMQLLLMLAVLGLIWVCLTSAGYSRWVTVVYLLVGLILLYALALLAVLPLPDWIYTLALYLSPESYLFQVGGAAAALGLISLFFWKPPAAAPDIEEGLPMD
jgi:hypothetical protein